MGEVVRGGGFAGEMRGAGGWVNQLGDGLEVGERFGNDETGGVQESVDAMGKERC